MTGIDNIESLAALMRTQVQAFAGTQAARRASPADVRGRAPSRDAAKGRPGREDLASVVARRVRAIDATDPDAGRRAFRIFLESVLLSELGEQLINDAAFYRLVDDVQAQMQSDPTLAPMIARASALLLGESRSPAADPRPRK